MTLAILLGLACIISYLSFYNTFPLFKLGAGAAWMVVFLYFKGNPPTVITEGSDVHIALLLVIILMAIAVPLSGLGRDIQRQRQSRSGSNGTGNNFAFSEFKWKFGRDKRELDDNYVAPHRETAEEYRDKVHSALRRK
jgi:hypothetical protein